MPGADMRVVVQVELPELHDFLEERGVLLGVQQRGRVVIVKAVMVAKIWGRMSRRHL